MNLVSKMMDINHIALVVRGWDFFPTIDQVIGTILILNDDDIIKKESLDYWVNFFSDSKKEKKLPSIRKLFLKPTWTFFNFLKEYEFFQDIKLEDSISYTIFEFPRLYHTFRVAYLDIDMSKFSNIDEITRHKYTNFLVDFDEWLSVKDTLFKIDSLLGRLSKLTGYNDNYSKEEIIEYVNLKKIFEWLEKSRLLKRNYFSHLSSVLPNCDLLGIDNYYVLLEEK